jgi:hypothetical protein
MVKNTSSDKPRNLGYYINVISELGGEFKVTKVQMRLIAQEFERCGLEDFYGIDKYQQETLFIEIAKRYLNVPERVLRRLLVN